MTLLLVNQKKLNVHVCKKYSRPRYLRLPRETTNCWGEWGFEIARLELKFYVVDKIESPCYIDIIES